MGKKPKYSLRYLPLFYEDLEGAVDYIANKLKNIMAANKLIDDVEEAIFERLPVCESFEQYNSKRERAYPYYRIYVNNYTIYYVVIEGADDEKIMEVRRILNNRQNRDVL